MRKMIVHCSAGFAGMDGMYELEVADDASEEEISEAANEMALEHASMYGIEPYGDVDEDDLDDEAHEHYSDNIEGWAEDYDPAKHGDDFFN
jgi:hypothetical protein